jgi:hypothetical protein
MIPFVGDYDPLGLALRIGDSLAPGWREPLSPDAVFADLDGYVAFPEHLAGAAALFRAALEAEVAGDDVQVGRLGALGDAETDRVEAAQQVSPTPKRLGRGDTPALSAWTRRGDSTTMDKLWQAACWEQQALALSNDGCQDGARSALAQAKVIVARAAAPPDGRAA